MYIFHKTEWTHCRRLATVIVGALSAASCIVADDAITFSNSQEQLLNVRADVTLHGKENESVGAPSIIGDIDGDGMDDMLVSYYTYPNGSAADPSSRAFLYVVYGRTDWSIDPSLAGEATINQDEQFANSTIGRGVPAGDVDGDGFDDFLLRDITTSACRRIDEATASGFHTHEELYQDYPEAELQGAVYLVYGGPQRLTGAHSINDIAVRIYDPAFCTYFGNNLSGIGDINGDGYDDFAVNTTLDHHSKLTEQAMRTYVFYGGPNRLAGTMSVTDAATAVLQQKGESTHLDHLSMAGDMNGDGYDDFFVGQYEHNSDTLSPPFYLVHGSANQLSGELDITTVATSADQALGHNPASVGDLNNDGRDDFITTVTHNGEYTKGIFYGRKDGFGATIRPEHVSGTLEMREWRNISAIVSAGDMDGDGNNDLMIGVPDYNNRTGAGFLVHSTEANFAESVLLDEQSTIFLGREGTRSYDDEGRTVVVESNDQAGNVICAGDLNGDGVTDFAINANGGVEDRVYLLLSPFVTP